MKSFTFIKKKIFANVSYIFLGQVISIGLGIILMGFLGRELSIEEFGILSLSITVYQLASGVIEFGLRPAIVHFSSLYFGKKEEDKAFGILKINLLVKFAIGFIVILLGLFLGRVLATYIYKDPGLIVPLQFAFATGALMNFKEFFKSAFRSLGRFKIHAIVQAIAPFYKLSAVLWVWKQENLNLILIFIIFLTAPIIACIFGSWFIPWIRIIKTKIKEKRIFLEILNLGKWMFFVYIIETFATKLDVLMLRYFTSDESVGYYFAAYQVLNILFLTSGVIATVLLPSVSKVVGERDISLKNFSLKILNYTSLLAFPMAFGLYGVAPELIRLIFGPKFITSIAVLKILVPAGLFAFLAVGTGPLIMNYKPYRLIGYLGVINLISNISLNLLLIPKYGNVGAAIATVASYGLLLLAGWYFIFSPLKIRFSDFKYIITNIFIAVLMFGVIALINTEPILLNFILKVISGVIIYSFLAYLFYRNNLLKFLRFNVVKQ